MLRIMYTAPLMRILVIEDEHRLARNIQSYLQMEEHYTVDAAFTGEEGVHTQRPGPTPPPWYPNGPRSIAATGDATGNAADVRRELQRA